MIHPTWSTGEPVLVGQRVKHPEYGYGEIDMVSEDEVEFTLDDPIETNDTYFGVIRHISWDPRGNHGVRLVVQ